MIRTTIVIAALLGLASSASAQVRCCTAPTLEERVDAIEQRLAADERAAERTSVPLTGEALDNAIKNNQRAHANDPIVLRGAGPIAKEDVPVSSWSGNELPVTGCHPDDGSLTCPPPPSGQHVPNWLNYNPNH